MSASPSANLAAVPGPVGILPREAVLGLSGRQALEELLAGTLPRAPMGRTLNFTLAEVGEGRIVFVGEPTADHLNPLGTVHGGWIGSLLDSAMGCAVHSLLKPGQIYTTTSMTINFLRALMPDSGVVRAEGTAVHAGSRLGAAEGRLIDSRGRLIAHGSETCMIMDAAPPPRA